MSVSPPVAKAQARLPLTSGHTLPGWEAVNSLSQQTRLASKPFLNFDHRLSFACLGCRTYPVREGEVLSDIILKRNISREEMKALNPGVNLDKLTGGAAQACSIQLPLACRPARSSWLSRAGNEAAQPTG